MKKLLFILILLTAFSGYVFQAEGAMLPPFYFDGTNIITRDATWPLRVPDLSNCDTIDTDADGVMSCGTDATGGAGGSGVWATTTNGIYPTSDAYDVMIGNVATSSAEFWFDVSSGDLTITGNLSSADSFLTTVDISDNTNLATSTGVSLTDDTLGLTLGAIDHDSLLNFVADEHLNWTNDLGAVNIHAGNYTDTNTNANTVCAGGTTYMDGEGNCDDLSNVYINEAGDSTGDLTSDLNIDSNTLVVDYDTNEVGIGVADPLARLHINYPSAGSVIFQAQAEGGGDDLDIKYGHNGYGWYWKYLGSGSGDGNELQLFSEGAGGADDQVYGIRQSGNITFIKDVAIEGVSTLATTTITALTVSGALNLPADSVTDAMVSNTLTCSACTGNAVTATALAANGANATSGWAIIGVDASGAYEGGFDVWTEAENTAAGYTSNTGDVTNVFNCSTGDCNTMTVGTSEWLTYGTGYIDANRFAGVTTVDGTEFGYLNDVSSAIQTQLNAKAPADSPTFTTAFTATGLIGDEDLQSESFGDFTCAGEDACTLNTGSVSDNEIDYANVTLTDFDYQTAWITFYSNAAGDVTELALGATTTVLTSNGLTTAPSWTAAGAGDMTKAVYDIGANNIVDSADDLTCTNCINATEIEDIYLLDGSSDTMTGTLTCDGLTMGANENITLGSNTLDHDGTDFVFNDTIAVSNDSISAAELNEGDTFTFTGTTFSLSGVTNMTIPAVANAASEIAIDTTNDDQFIYYGDEANVITAYHEKCFTDMSATTTHDNIGLWAPHRAITVTDVYCWVDAGTSIAVTLSDGTNALEEVVCTTAGAADDGSITNGAFTANEKMEYDTGAFVGAATRFTYCITYKVVQD